MPSGLAPAGGSRGNSGSGSFVSGGGFLGGSSGNLTRRMSAGAYTAAAAGGGGGGGSSIGSGLDRCQSWGFLYDAKRANQAGGVLAMRRCNSEGSVVAFVETSDLALRLSQRSECRVVRFSVEDSGAGVPEDKLHLLFRPFSQIASSTGAKAMGTGCGGFLIIWFLSRFRSAVDVCLRPASSAGSTAPPTHARTRSRTRPRTRRLGLTIVKRLVEAMSGTISFESEIGAILSESVECPRSSYNVFDDCLSGDIALSRVCPQARARKCPW